MIRTVLVGLGQVGAGYDFENCNYKRSHLGAMLLQKNIKIIRLIDKNKRKFNKIKKFYSKIPLSFSDSISKIDQTKIDLCVIATTTGNHEQVIRDIVKYQPKLIICEKPLTYFPDKEKKILDYIIKEKIKLFINYHRKFDSRFKQLSQKLKENEFNKLIFKYGKGFLNNASHMLEFLIRTSGKVKNFKIIRKKKFGKDFLIDLCIEFNSGLIAYFISFDKYKFDMFDMEFYSKNRKIEILNGGFEINQYSTKKNLIYKNYSSLKLLKKTNKPFGNGFEKLYENVSKYFNEKKHELDSSMDDYYYLSSIIKKILS